jgi:hypothetical protein
MSGTGARNALAVICVALSLGCGAVKERTAVRIPPAFLEARVATLPELVELIDRRWAAPVSLTVARFQVEFTGGSIDEGYFEKYRTAKGYLVAQRPDSVFVNILNPLTSSSVLVMASREHDFQIWIPTRNQFVVGSTDIRSDQDNPVYNVRPRHILEAILIDPVKGAHNIHFLEEAQDTRNKYYVIGVLTPEDSSTRVLQLRRKLWIERSTLSLARQQQFSGGALISEAEYGEPVEVGDRIVPTSVDLRRPVDRYSISFRFDPTSIQLDREIPEDSFILQQPAGAERVQVDDQD